MIHCRYGCKQIPDCVGDYEEDPTGMFMYLCAHVTNEWMVHLSCIAI